MASIFKKLSGVSMGAIHRFNERGEPVLAIVALTKRIQELEIENDRLRRILSAKAARATEASSDVKQPRH